MGVRRRNEDVIGGQTGFLLNDFLRGIKDWARDHATIAHGNGKPGFTVIESQATGVKFIVNVNSLAVVEVTIDGQAETWGDVAVGSPHAESRGIGFGSRRRGREAREGC